jgi:hypothetical protein
VPRIESDNEKRACSSSDHVFEFIDFDLEDQDNTLDNSDYGSDSHDEDEEEVLFGMDP